MTDSADSRKEFSKIFDDCINKIYRFVFVKVNSEEVAQDLTSETFAKGWEAFRESCGPDCQKIDNPSAFLYKIARNLVIDYYREKGRTQVVSAENELFVDPRQNVGELAGLNVDLIQIKTALTGIKEEYQDIIVWHYLDDLNVREIAKMTEKSEEATRTTLHRALRALKAELTPPIQEV